jgi:CAAX protease family protein
MPKVVISAVGAAILGLGLVAASGSQAIERRERGGAAYVGPSPFLVFAASIALSILVVILVIGPAAALGLDTASPPATLLSVSITALVYVGLIRLLVVGTGSLDWGAMGVGRFGPQALAELAWGALLAMPVIVVTSVLSLVLVGLTGATPDSPLPTPGSPAGLALNLLAATIVAPIGEELFYRGFATTAWARTMGPSRALVRGAVFFALIHVLTIGGSTFGEAAGIAFVAFVARLPVSVALGWVFLRRRSIYASIGLHATYNGLLVILSQLAVAALQR